VVTTEEFLHILEGRTKKKGKIFLLAASKPNSYGGVQASLIQMDANSMSRYTTACRTLLGATDVTPERFQARVTGTVLAKITIKMEVDTVLVDLSMPVMAIGHSHSINVPSIGEARPLLLEKAAPGIIDMATKGAGYSHYSNNPQSSSDSLGRALEKSDPEAKPSHGQDMNTYQATQIFLEYITLVDPDIRSYFLTRLEGMPWLPNCHLSVEFDPREVMQKVGKAYGLH
jgi:hypothetical protein